MDSLLRTLERLHHADPCNIDVARHLIATYQRLGRGLGEEEEEFRSKPKIRKMKGKAVSGVEISQDRIDKWIDVFLANLRHSDGTDLTVPFSWIVVESSDNAEHRVTNIMCGDTLLIGYAWRYIGTYTWYVSFDTAKRDKHYYGERTFKRTEPLSVVNENHS